MPSSWILEPPIRKSGRCRLICFPYAGGGASLFTSWTSLSPAAEAVPVQLPGRENRLREPAATRLEDLVPNLLQALGSQLFGPWAVFGHSFGGLLAYELARAAVRDGYQQPEAVFVSACRPPDVETRFAERLHELDDDDLIAALEDLGAAPTPLFADPELRQLVLPAVRADIEVCETYEHRPDDVLEAPIVAICGTDDHHADCDEMKRWAEFTSGPFELAMVSGDHFFLRTNATTVIDCVRDRLDALAADVG